MTVISDIENGRDSALYLRMWIHYITKLWSNFVEKRNENKRCTEAIFTVIVGVDDLII